MKFKKKKGFTLIEIIAGLAIFVIVLTTATSLIITLFKYNSINKETFDSNSKSKIFFETVRGNRPSDIYTYPSDNNYYIAFNDDNDLVVATKDNLLKNTLNSTSSYVMGTCNGGDGLGALKAKPGVIDKKYVLKVNAKKNTTQKVYEFYVSTWNIPKGETSIIERKALISTEK
ncbi:prepilin-type N-terminal cleavage/methylation domain-containing protein [Clostridium baratii]|uniref:prepilin-type N-terminal cleavage/methylation domain-containing protein n=1 Tax=Clostridium baratii TaxID=1561 RepID=UPI003D33BC23